MQSYQNAKPWKLDKNSTNVVDLTWCTFLQYDPLKEEFLPFLTQKQKNPKNRHIMHTKILTVSP